MKYLTRAGVKFLKEANQKIKLSNLQNLPHPGQGIGKQTGNTNLSRNNPGYEERMEGHQTKMDNRRKVNKKMKRDVNEGMRDWFRRLKQKPGEWTDARKKRASDRAVKQAFKKADQDKIDAMMAQTDTKHPAVIKNDLERAQFNNSMRGK